MRTAYALMGLMWVIVIGGLVVLNHKFTGSNDTGMNDTHTTSTPMATSLMLTSPVFAANASIPRQYTCEGENTPPPLSIAGAPEGTKSFALIMEDPDVPLELKPDGTFLHWVLFNIPAETTKIGPTGSVGVSGLNGAGSEGYTGPCPPKEYEPSEHRYVFTLFALDTMLGLESGATREEVVQAMEGHIVGEAKLIGRYRKI